ncbi:hypothetical protein [Allosediminivita pacifica]|uniref:Uncharacterized protein n=1 Tax=Allosediminivita pacifica TaxID=1267769 RepID=A0A2T6AW50_9RHOB|nr:hypothetical protein [Allosediminivita pacifica]PTX48043.1 hypothetical protein C8N44_11042 [Allosediminivita pacifica]GGB11783.1 hypothetical protein GCM10011324_22370 [Allosediminivita pacifica]
MELGRKECLDAGLGAIALAGAAVAAAGVALGSAPAEAGKPVLVVAPPWSDGAVAISIAAGGRPVGPYAAAFGALAVFDGTVPVPVLMARGAWAVRGGEALAAICGVTSE